MLTRPSSWQSELLAVSLLGSPLESMQLSGGERLSGGIEDADIFKYLGGVADSTMRLSSLPTSARLRARLHRCSASGVRARYWLHTRWTASVAICYLCETPRQGS